MQRHLITIVLFMLIASASHALSVSPKLAIELAKTGQTVACVKVVPWSNEKNAPAGAGSQKAIAAGQTRVLKALGKDAETRVRYRYKNIPFISLAVDTNTLETLKATGGVQGVYHDVRVQGAMLESLPLIHTPEIVDTLGFDGTGSTVAIIDTGYETTHPDLLGAAIATQRFLEQGLDTGTNVEDDHGHGTHVAGIVTGDGNVAPRGIAPGADLVVVKALDYENLGWMSDIIAAYDWLVSEQRAGNINVHWINASFVIVGYPVTDCPCNSLGSEGGNEQAFRELVWLGKGLEMTLIAAAGNDGVSDDDLDGEGDSLRAPACFSQVISVGATYDSTFTRAPYVGDFSALGAPCYDLSIGANDIACFSSRNRCLDFVAPGYEIVAAGLGGSTTARYGTSQAAAHVTGTLALVESIKPGLDSDTILQMLRDAAVATQDPLFIAASYPRIDASATATLLQTLNDARHWTVFE